MRIFLKTLTGKLWIYFIIIFLIPFLVVGSYQYIQNKTLTEVRLINERNIQLMQVRNSFYSVFLNATNVCNALYNNRNVRNYLISDLNNIDDNSYKSLDKVFELVDFSNVLMKDAINISIIRRDGWFISTESDTQNVNLDNIDKIWEKELSSGDLYVFTKWNDKAIENHKGNTVISIVRKVSDIRKSNTTGFLVVNISENAFKQIFSAIDKNMFSEVLLCDTNSNVIASAHGLFENYSTLIPKMGTYPIQTINDNKYVLMINDIELYGMKMLAFIPYSTIAENARNTLTYSLMIFLIVILFTFTIMFFMLKKITHPIKTLIEKMEYNYREKVFSRAEIKGNYEIKQLSLKYNAMLDEIDFLINKIEINQQEKLEFEISALQSQINPHFIYNTLSTIRWMAIIQGNNSIVKMLDAFINLMKYCSNFKESLITLKNEKSFLEEYVYIQNVRYNSSIYITMDFEKDTLKCKILKFILQPLVENSVFHGFSSQCQQREIRIVAKILNDKLIIEVIDNGQGIKQEILEDILSHKNNDNGLTGIGINNVCRRIQAKFGEEYGLSISSIPNQGCTVKVVLPIIL